MRRSDFERPVLQALEEIPDQFRDALHNIDVQVRWRPTPAELRRAGVRRGSLFGLYVGVPLTKRGHHYSMTVPDTILVYQDPPGRPLPVLRARPGPLPPRLLARPHRAGGGDSGERLPLGRRRLQLRERRNPGRRRRRARPPAVPPPASRAGAGG